MYGHGAGIVTKENSRIFSLMHIHYLPSARACRQ